MRLHTLKIEGFRRLQNNTVDFGDATFLIGANNTGKSTVLRAIDHLLSANKRIKDEEYYSIVDEETGEQKTATDKIVFEAEFRNLPEDAKEWRGFKGRIFEYEVTDAAETGLCIFYRKTYELGKDVVIELRSKKRTLKESFKKCQKPQDFIDLGVGADLIKSLFPDLAAKISAKERINLEAVDEIWDIAGEEEWFQNPGGIPGNVLSRLPRFLLIPAHTSYEEIQDEKKGVLGKTLSELFEDVRNASKNYAEAQKYLNELAKELNPEDQNSDFGKMLSELNQILASVFPESELHAKADLSDPDKALSPSFKIEMSSNVKTEVQNQGTGMIRSAAFGVLRYRQKWLSKREDKYERALIIGFEEPEIYLHPSAANQMRNTIYELSGKTSQIVATTHSPFMIDLARKPRQVLNRFSIGSPQIIVTPFSVTKAFQELTANDKTYVKMLLKIDDYVARVFFTKNVVVVEGDTEDITIRESLRILPEELRMKILCDFEIIKARGKATIVGLAKYLNAMNIRPIVVHDRDAGTAGAESINKAITAAVDAGKVIQLHECIEDVLGYKAPSAEKPYHAFRLAKEWNKWSDLPSNWQKKLEEIFESYINGAELEKEEKNV